MTADFKLQIELLMNKMKEISDTDVLSRHDILHKMEWFTNTSKLEGIDLGNYEYFLAKGRKIVKLGYKKELHCENLLLFLAVF